MKLKQETFTMPDGTTGTVTHGSGNVFADLELPDADELKWKADLMVRIGHIIESKGLTQVEIAKRARINRSEVSRLLNGRITTFSVGRLLLILNRLGHSVEVRVAEREVAPEHAHTIITAVAKVA
jgi:predicted XRE-type DNA-binding protein